MDTVNNGSLNLDSNLSLTEESQLHSSLIPLFIPFYKSDKNFEMPLEIKRTNHRSFNFNDYRENYISAYNTTKELIGLKNQFYAFPFIIRKQKIKSIHDDLELCPILDCDYQPTQDDKACQLIPLSFDDTSDLIESLFDIQVGERIINIFD